MRRAYKAAEKVSKEAEQKKRLIENALAVRNPRITKTENAQTREFYTVYSEGITDEFREGRLAGRTTQLGIVNIKGELLPESEIFGGGPVPTPTPTSTPMQTGWTCSRGHAGNTSRFCPVCGEPKPGVGWTCIKGHKGNTGIFCCVCGEPKPAESWDCPQCGKKGIKGNFCDVCGTKKPVKMAAPSGEWNCTACGNTGNTGIFCWRCGSKRP